MEASKEQFHGAATSKKIGSDSKVATVAVAASAADDTVATPDSADIADGVIADVAIVVVAIVIDVDANATVCVGDDYPPGIFLLFLSINIHKFCSIFKATA